MSWPEPHPNHHAHTLASEHFRITVVPALGAALARIQCRNEGNWLDIAQGSCGAGGWNESERLFPFPEELPGLYSHGFLHAWPWAGRLEEASLQLPSGEKQAITHPDGEYAAHGLANLLSFEEIPSQELLQLLPTGWRDGEALALQTSTASLMQASGYPAELSLELLYVLKGSQLIWLRRTRHIHGPSVPFSELSHPFFLRRPEGSQQAPWVEVPQGQHSYPLQDGMHFPNPVNHVIPVPEEVDYRERRALQPNLDHSYPLAPGERAAVRFGWDELGLALEYRDESTDPNAKDIHLWSGWPNDAAPETQWPVWALEFSNCAPGQPGVWLDRGDQHMTLLGPGDEFVSIESLSLLGTS